MKTERAQSRTLRREHPLDEIREDSYRENGKLAEPSHCPKCGATFLKGRWTWGKAPADAPKHKCPACQRIEDQFPAGYVALKGPFVATHRDDILNLVRAREARAREEHPLQRIMAVETTAEGVVVTTTDAHLARGIAVAVNAAFKGTLDMTYSKDENLLRATWKR
jgi:NMD protein affecting ribosome stability and mRNA decay